MIEKLKKLASSLKFFQESIVDAVAYDDKTDYSFIESWRLGLEAEANGDVIAAENSYLVGLTDAKANGLSNYGASLLATSLADLYQNERRFAEAEENYKFAIAFFEKSQIFNGESEQALLAEFGADKYAEVQAIRDRVLSLSRYFLSGRKSRYVQVLESYACLLRKTNRRDEAASLEQRAELQKKSE